MNHRSGCPTCESLSGRESRARLNPVRWAQEAEPGPLTAGQATVGRRQDNRGPSQAARHASLAAYGLAHTTRSTHTAHTHTHRQAHRASMPSPWRAEASIRVADSNRPWWGRAATRILIHTPTRIVC
ncbi:unnamed protein product [Protopolystoma xenopodis]|uniref:Uncharacterized protein n=1 Tax=Protopolystoma xenopodis TaxID=117903 RepID=A0A3S5CMI8_9PLAT|nr:unnamed protein product [Protopolystoma xenopodis]